MLFYRQFLLIFYMLVFEILRETFCIISNKIKVSVLLINLLDQRRVLYFSEKQKFFSKLIDLNPSKFKESRNHCLLASLVTHRKEMIIFQNLVTEYSKKIVLMIAWSLDFFLKANCTKLVNIQQQVQSSDWQLILIIYH